MQCCGEILPVRWVAREVEKAGNGAESQLLYLEEAFGLQRAHDDSPTFLLAIDGCCRSGRMEDFGKLIGPYADKNTTFVLSKHATLLPG